MDIPDLIAIAALLLSLGIYIRDYFLPAKIEIYHGDSLRIVHSDRNKIQIDFNFTNPTPKLAVINRLRAYLLTPDQNRQLFKWNLFYKLEGATASLDKYPTSVVVLAKESNFQGIEFIADDRFAWSPGNYELSVEVWFNRGMNKRSNKNHMVKFSLSGEDANFLNDLANRPFSGMAAAMRPVAITN